MTPLTLSIFSTLLRVRLVSALRVPAAGTSEARHFPSVERSLSRYFRRCNFFPAKCPGHGTLPEQRIHMEAD